MSAGRQPTSRWCTAMSLSCTFVPAPIFWVEPNRTRTCPDRTLAKSSFFFASVSASWIKAISSFGTPAASSLSRMSSYTLNVPSPFGVDKSQNRSCVSLSAFPSSQIRSTLRTQALSLLSGSSGSSGFINLWSNPSLRPSDVIFSILSCEGSTMPEWTAAARSDSSATIAF